MSKNNLPKIRVLLDTDANNEIDDQHAIAYLLLSGDRFILEGITVNRTNNGGDITSKLKRQSASSSYVIWTIRFLSHSALQTLFLRPTQK